jgi:secreted PhoX family phosphatase
VPRRRLTCAALAGGTIITVLAGGTTALAAHAAPAGGIISTVAGGVGGPGPATAISLVSDNVPAGACGSPEGAADVAAAPGRLYIADGSVRQVSEQTGALTTPAGTGTAGPLGLGGPAAKSAIAACGVEVDHAGNVVIADPNSRRLLLAAATTGTFYGQKMTAGHIYAVAGDGGPAPGGSGVPATKTALNSPIDVAVDAAGNLVIADEGTAQSPGPQRGSRVRVVAASTGTFYGQPMKAGDIYTVAGSIAGKGFSGDGGPAVRAAIGEFLLGVQVDATGNLVLATSDNQRVRVVAAKTGTFYGVPMTKGDIYTVAGNGTPGSTGDGGPATQAELANPDGVGVDSTGNLLIGDTGNNLVRMVAVKTGTFYGVPMTAGDIYTVAGGGSGAPHLGDGGPATSATLAFPEGLTVDAAGNLVIADFGDARARVVAASTGSFYGQAMTKDDIYTVAGDVAADFCCDGSPATTAEMNGPGQAVTDHAGNIVIADESDNRIRVVAASTGSFYGQAMIKGDIYTVAGNGKSGISANGTPATQAELRVPEGVQVDQAGNLVIVVTFANMIQVVAAKTGTFYGLPMIAGDIYTIAGTGVAHFAGDGGPATKAGLWNPSGVALDGAGNVLIADKEDNRIRVVAVNTGTFYGRAMKAGDIYTVAGDGTFGFSGDGGPATSAELGTPAGVTTDHAGHLVIADTHNQRVRVVAVKSGTFYGRNMTAGDIYTIAGNGLSGFAGDGGPATAAEFNAPQAVAVDAMGDVVIADTNFGGAPADQGNNRVRVVAASTGEFYGVPMTKGDIYTVGGNGQPGFSGDGGPATQAELDAPMGLGVTGAGNLLVADVNDGRVREITR